MVARGLLKDPVLLEATPPGVDHWDLLREWIDINTEHPISLPFGILRQHAYWILKGHIKKSQRNSLLAIADMDELRDVLRTRLSAYSD